MSKTYQWETVEIEITAQERAAWVEALNRNPVTWVPELPPFDWAAATANTPIVGSLGKRSPALARLTDDNSRLGAQNEALRDILADVLLAGPGPILQAHAVAAGIEDRLIGQGWCFISGRYERPVPQRGFPARALAPRGVRIGLVAR